MILYDFNLFFHKKNSDSVVVQNNKVELEVRLDSRIHARIIGSKGAGLRKFQDKYKVDVRFPRRGDPNEDPDTVYLVGDEDKVYEAETELKRLEDLYVSSGLP